MNCGGWIPTRLLRGPMTPSLRLFLVVTMLLLVGHGQGVVDISRHNSLHYEKTAELEASAALVACDQVVQTSRDGGYFGSTSRMVAQMHLVGVATREQIVHVVLNSVFTEYCDTATIMAANHAVQRESTTIATSKSTTITKTHQQQQQKTSSFEDITGFHFGPLESWCDPSSSNTLCRSAMTVSVFGEESSSLYTTEALFQYILREIPSLSPRYSQLIDVAWFSKKGRQRTLSWSTAIWIILLVLIASLLAIILCIPPTHNKANTEDIPTSSSSSFQKQTKAAANTAPRSIWPWDAATVATAASTKTSSSSSSSSSSSHTSSSMYLTILESTIEEEEKAHVETLSRATIAASLLTEHERLVDWLVPIVEVQGDCIDEDNDDEVTSSFSFT